MGYARMCFFTVRYDRTQPECHVTGTMAVSILVAERMYIETAHDSYIDSATDQLSRVVDQTPSHLAVDKPRPSVFVLVSTYCRHRKLVSRLSRSAIMQNPTMAIGIVCDFLHAGRRRVWIGRRRRP